MCGGRQPGRPHPGPGAAMIGKALAAAALATAPALAARPGRRAAGEDLRAGQRRGHGDDPGSAGRRRGLPAGLRRPGGERPQQGRGAVRPVLVLARARPRGAPGAPRTRAALRRGRQVHPAHPGQVQKGLRGADPARRRRTCWTASRRRQPRPAARPDDADLGRALLRAGLRRAVPARGARPDRGERRRRRHGAEVRAAAEHAPPGPADEVPAAAARRRPAPAAGGADPGGAGLLPAGHVLQHRRRADVRGDGAPADDRRAAPGRAAAARRAPGRRRLPRPGDRRRPARPTRCSASRTGSPPPTSSWRT